MCSRRPRSVGRLRVKPAPKGVTLISRVISIHSKSGVSRQCTRTGSLSSNRSRTRFQFLCSLIPVFGSCLESPVTVTSAFAQASFSSPSPQPDARPKPLILLGLSHAQGFAKTRLGDYNNHYLRVDELSVLRASQITCIFLKKESLETAEREAVPHFGNCGEVGNS